MFWSAQISNFSSKVRSIIVFFFEGGEKVRLPFCHGEITGILVIQWVYYIIISAIGLAKIKGLAEQYIGIGPCYILLYIVVSCRSLVTIYLKIPKQKTGVSLFLFIHSNSQLIRPMILLFFYFHVSLKLYNEIVVTILD